ncbi:MAG: HAMP domain-containing histidine kinase [Alphaproteobacteria bacterium]|nr:HAMP domain-containing histidine kinase [Alphaproteobacteria bacterium]
MVGPQKILPSGAEPPASDADGISSPTDAPSQALIADEATLTAAWPLFEAVPDLIAVIVDNLVSRINGAGAALIGAANPAAVAGLRFDSIFDPRAVHTLLLHWQKGADQPGIGAWYRSRIARLDGAIIEADIRIAPMTSRGALGVVARPVDSPALRVDELSTAAHATEGVKQLVTNLAHELRTPLNAIIGFSDVIAQQMFGQIGSRYRSYASDIHDSGQHLLRVINDILDYAKLDAGQMILRPEPARIDEIVRASVRLVADQAERAGVTLADLIPGDGRIVNVDVTKIKQVLVNLLINSIKFTPRGGRVGVGLNQDEDGKVAVFVADSGIGMTEAEVAEALLPFHQPKQQIEGGYVGTGLGLPIAKALISLHGGEMRIDSVPKKGTTVRFTLPTVRE